MYLAKKQVDPDRVRPSQRGNDERKNKGIGKKWTGANLTSAAKKSSPGGVDRWMDG